MNINIISSQANSNLLMGYVTAPIMQDVFIDSSILSVTDKEIYDNFFAEFGNHVGFNISNCEIECDFNRVTTDVVVTDQLNLDFDTLTEMQQLIVVEFIVLLETV
jgi:hypothetical protein